MKNAGTGDFVKSHLKHMSCFASLLSVSYSSGTDFIQIGEHYYWLYNPEENSDWGDMFPVSPVCDLCGIVLYVLGKAGGVC